MNAEKLETYIKSVKEIIENNGFCRGTAFTSCSDCPFFDFPGNECGVKCGVINGEEFLEVCKKWLTKYGKSSGLFVKSHSIKRY